METVSKHNEQRIAQDVKKKSQRMIMTMIKENKENTIQPKLPLDIKTPFQKYDSIRFRRNTYLSIQEKKDTEIKNISKKIVFYRKRSEIFLQKGLIVFVLEKKI